jgi:hypothetical protein
MVCHRKIRNGSYADMARRVARLTDSAALWGGGFCPVVPGSREHLAELR